MTCREFKHEASSRSLHELTQTNEAALAGHAESCRRCGEWLEKQRALAASLHTLGARTVSLTAGENVEQALLHVFRKGVPAGQIASAAAVKVPASGLKHVAGIEKHSANAAPRSTAISGAQGFAWHLSRLFGFGAYAAVAAAIAVAIFLGVHLLRRDVKTAPSQAQSAPEQVVPLSQQSPSPINVAAKAIARTKTVSERAEASSRSLASRRHQAGAVATPAADQWQSEEAEYTPLMFCDPLSCSSETQVVRMELPSAGAQPQTADVVVGFDGMVRAVRFVN